MHSKAERCWSLEAHGRSNQRLERGDPHQEADRDTRGLGALVAEKFAAEGCSIAINYVSNADRAKQTAEKLEKEYNAKIVLIQGVCDVQTALREAHLTDRGDRTGCRGFGGL